MYHEKLLVVLGSPNSSIGELSTTAMERLDCCAKMYHEQRCSILCTGGWGEHFNLAKEPHAEYAKRYLSPKGVLRSDILEFALSQNTVQDAVKTKEIISKLKFDSITVITSDYHLDRARLIFDEILIHPNLMYVGTTSKLSQSELDSLKKHEIKAINQIKKNGLYY
ncbi:MAG: YdcF family protein [Reichenbachiella sp.]|uniref:YdcF family protein n=1 Tax=Reichenbachiella sp. TaxID=2184521 RepID=UPI0032641A4A